MTLSLGLMTSDNHPRVSYTGITGGRNVHLDIWDQSHATVTLESKQLVSATNFDVHHAGGVQ